MKGRRESLYQWVVCRGGDDHTRHKSVDEAFRDKKPDVVYVELLATGYRARVLRPGPEYRE